MQFKKVTLRFDEQMYDVPNTPQEFLAFWKEKIDQVPEEYKSTASISLYTGADYGCPCIRFSITYERPETEDEKFVRDQRDNTRAEEVRREDMRTLAKLQAKYS